MFNLLPEPTTPFTSAIQRLRSFSCSRKISAFPPPGFLARSLQNEQVARHENVFDVRKNAVFDAARFALEDHDP
jgi:hypothetical protein